MSKYFSVQHQLVPIGLVIEVALIVSLTVSYVFSGGALVVIPLSNALASVYLFDLEPNLIKYLFLFCS